MQVEWVGWRGDVLNGLDTLAAEPPRLKFSERDPRWPDLVNAVHWVVDDTGWDLEDPAGHIGLIVCDEEEASALREVVVAVVGVSERQGPLGSDRSWFDDRDWPRVRELAAAAARLMRRNLDC